MSAPRILQHDMAIWVYLPGLTLAEGMAQAVPLVDRVWKKFAANLTLGSRVSTPPPPAPPAKWYEGPDFLGYGSASHVGMIFNYLVKESGESFTVEAGARHENLRGH